MNLVTVEDNKKEYSTLECIQANKVRNLQHLHECLSDLVLAHDIEHKQCNRKQQICQKGYQHRNHNSWETTYVRREDDVLKHSPTMRKWFNSYGAIRYLGESLARYIFRAPKYLKTRSIVYFGHTLITDAGIELSSRVIC